MIKRVLEPEVMDSAEEAIDYDSMDHREVNRVFVEDFLAIWKRTVPVLDVGTGTAQIPIELCQQAGPTAIVAIDLAAHMLHVGRENVQQAGFQESIQLQLCDAKSMPFDDHSFGAVISNSIIHHIPDPAQVIKEMARVLIPGGTLLVRDLLRPESNEEVERLVHLYAGDCNDHQQKMFRESLHAALTLDEIRELVTAVGFPAKSVQQTTDRHWTWQS